MFKLVLVKTPGEQMLMLTPGNLAVFSKLQSIAGRFDLNVYVLYGF